MLRIPVTPGATSRPSSSGCSEPSFEDDGPSLGSGIREEALEQDRSQERGRQEAKDEVE